MSTELSSTSVPAINPLFRLQFEKAQDSWVLLYPEGMVKLNQSAFETEVLLTDVTGFVDVAMQQNWLSIREPA